jgi:RHS repeat-associated protein
VLADYAYDALGRRVIERLYPNQPGESWARHLYDGSRVTEERDPTSANHIRLKKRYLWGSEYIDQLWALDTFDASGVFTQRYFASHDLRYNVRSLVKYSAGIAANNPSRDRKGADATSALSTQRPAPSTQNSALPPQSSVVERYRYTPYGVREVLVDGGGVWIPRTTQPVVGNPIGVMGLRHDWLTGLIFARMRTLEPSLGRFTQRDPILYSDGMNLYEFARSNPLRFRDPFGTDSGDEPEFLDSEWSNWFEGHISSNVYAVERWLGEDVSRHDASLHQHGMLFGASGFVAPLELGHYALEAWQRGDYADMTLHGLEVAGQAAISATATYGTLRGIGMLPGTTTELGFPGTVGRIYGASSPEETRAAINATWEARTRYEFINGLPSSPDAVNSMMVSPRAANFAQRSRAVLKNLWADESGSLNIGRSLGFDMAAGTSVRLVPGQPGIVAGGNSNVLGMRMMEAMGLPEGTRWTGYRAHHIIPIDAGRHPVIKK